MEWTHVNYGYPTVTLQPIGDYLCSEPVLVFHNGVLEKAIYQKDVNGEWENWALIFGEDYLQVELDEIEYWMPMLDDPE